MYIYAKRVLETPHVRQTETVRGKHLHGLVLWCIILLNLRTVRIATKKRYVGMTMDFFDKKRFLKAHPIIINVRIYLDKLSK